MFTVFSLLSFSLPPSGGRGGIIGFPKKGAANRVIRVRVRVIRWSYIGHAEVTHEHRSQVIPEDDALGARC